MQQGLERINHRTSSPQAWIDAADEALFLRLMAELAAQTADRELARDELAAQYEIWRKAL